jgi:hypothetical protein
MEEEMAIVPDAPDAQPAKRSLAAPILQACSDGLPGGHAHQTYEDLGALPREPDRRDAPDRCG